MRDMCDLKPVRSTEPWRGGDWDMKCAWPQLRVKVVGETMVSRAVWFGVFVPGVCGFVAVMNADAAAFIWS